MARGSGATPPRSDTAARPLDAKRLSGEHAAPSVALVTDLDACLLDERTYSWEPARPALEALRACGVPLVLASSKTRAEMQPLAEALGDVAALIVENGGAIVPVKGLPGLGAAPVVLGERRERLLAALEEIARETGARVRPFAGLTPRDIAALTGLDLAAARAALAREHDEPFILDQGDGASIARAAEARGLAVTRGGRFHHLTGPTDKGRALGILRERGRAAGWTPAWIALGDSPNDCEMLASADRPVIVPRRDGTADPTLAVALPHAAVAPAPGPEGWNAAVLAILSG